MKPDAPERYVVVRGDTLWSIAQRYTDSPWRWPELWNLNKDDIKNPHRIYPGNVIVLDRTKGRLALSSDTVKLSPHVRAESTAQGAIPSIPSSIIEPFLTRPLVIEADGLDKAPTIVATTGNRINLENGDRAFAKGIGDASQDSRWLVYRRGNPLIDPDSNTTLGYEAIYLGSARVIKAGDPAVIELSSVYREVGVGDKLIAAGRPEIPTYAPHAPAGTVRGRIISIYGDSTTVSEAGNQSIIAINQGRNQGLDIGSVLALYRSGATVAKEARSSSKESKNAPLLTLPDERYGIAFVFRVFDRVSYALVMNISMPVNKLDLVQNP
jgi:LysM domain